MPNSGQNFTFLGGTLDSIAVILSKNVGDVSAVFELVVVRNLEVLGILSGEGIAKLIAKKTDMHTVQNSVAEGTRPGALSEDQRNVVRDLRARVVDQVEVQHATDDAERSLTVLDNDGLGEAVHLIVVLPLEVCDLLTERSNDVLEGSVVEVFSVAELVIEMSISDDSMRDGQSEWAWR